MAIINDTSPKRPVQRPSNPSPQPSQPAAYDDDYKSNTVDTRYHDRSALLTYISGSSWYVTYYQQVLGESTELGPLQLDKDPVYQQYTRIDNFELKVTAPLTGNQESDDSSFDVQGTASVYPPLRPNNGDMFVADVGDGRRGLFAVVSSQRMSMLNDSVYEINYVLVSYATPEYLGNLAEKTIRQMHFVKELLATGGNPLVEDQKYDAYRTVVSYHEQLTQYYIHQFYNKSVSTLVLPDQPRVTYDAALVRAVQSIMDTDATPLMRDVRAYNSDLPGYTRPSTFWDAFLNLAYEQLRMCRHRFVVVDALCFGAVPQHDGVAFSGVKDVIYPADARDLPWTVSDFIKGYTRGMRSVREQLEDSVMPPGNGAPVKDVVGNQNLSGYDYDSENTTPQDSPLFHPVTVDRYYVLSEAFYRNQPTKQSRLEELTLQAMKGQHLNSNDLVELCDKIFYRTWLEQFYYIPILLVLLRLNRA